MKKASVLKQRCYGLIKYSSVIIYETNEMHMLRKIFSDSAKEQDSQRIFQCMSIGKSQKNNNNNNTKIVSHIMR